MIHELRNRQAGFAIGLTERFRGWARDVGSSTGHCREITKGCGGDFVGVVAGDGKTEVDICRHGDAHRAQEGPALAIQAAEAVELIASPLNAQPGIWIIHWK